MPRSIPSGSAGRYGGSGVFWGATKVSGRGMFPGSSLLRRKSRTWQKAAFAQLQSQPGGESTESDPVFDQCRKPVGESQTAGRRFAAAPEQRDSLPSRAVPRAPEQLHGWGRTVPTCFPSSQAGGPILPQTGGCCWQRVPCQLLRGTGHLGTRTRSDSLNRRCPLVPETAGLNGYQDASHSSRSADDFPAPASSLFRTRWQDPAGTRCRHVPRHIKQPEMS